MALRAGLLAAVLTIVQPRAARAEDSVTYKFQSWQEDNGRVRVDAHYALLEADVLPDTRLKLMGLIDSIAGATPTGAISTGGAPVRVTQMEDERKAWDANLAHQFKRVNVAAGYANSRESDYVSHGWSLNTLTDFNQKNTTLLLGYAGTDDTIKPVTWANSLKKSGDDAIVGVTQLLDANTSLTANLSGGRARGYLADPYKLVSKTLVIPSNFPGFPPVTVRRTPVENRPASREKLTVFLGANRHIERLRGALDASYRLYDDDFGVTSHTASLEWFQKIGSRVVVRPGVRYYRQSAADFYYYDLNATSIIPQTNNASPAGPNRVGTGEAPFYSSDGRLSKMQTLNLGLKVIWTVTSWLTVDATYERYLAKGLDGVTPADVYADADVFTVGLKLSR